MIKTNQLNKVFTTEEVETTALHNIDIHIQEGVCLHYGTFRMWEIHSAQPDRVAR